MCPERALSRWVDRGRVLNDHLANATGPHHRRRPRRLRSRLADREPRRARRAARDAARCARPPRTRPSSLAELVCSNSFRSDERETNAVGLLHEEMRRLGSLIMRCGDAHQVPAGGALAVDRDGFSAAVTAALEAHPLIEIAREEIALPPDDWDSVIVATGPLTSPALADAVRGLTGEDSLAFFDAIAPIVHRDSIDMSVAWFQSRYDKAGPGGSGADYINCPLTREQYDAFVDALLAGDKIVVPRMGSEHALFRRLPADRGDGGARARDLAPWADEAVRPHQSAPADSESLRGRATAPGQQARHAVQHGRLPDQAETRRSGARVPHHSGAGKGRVRAARRRSSQHLPQFAKAARCHAAAERGAAAALRRPDHRLRGLRGIRRDRPARRPLRRRRAARRTDRRCRRRPPRMARCSATSPAVTSRRSMPGRARSSR